MKANNDIKYFIAKIARSIFFIFFIGGLFLLLSMLLESLCNNFIFKKFHVPCINTMEAAGIVAFVYIIFFGIKFGSAAGKSKGTN